MDAVAKTQPHSRGFECDPLAKKQVCYSKKGFLCATEKAVDFVMFHNAN